MNSITGDRRMSKRRQDETMISRVVEKEYKGMSIIDAITEIMKEDEIDPEDITEKLSSEMIERIKIEFAKRRYRSAKRLYPDVGDKDVSEMFR